MLQSRRSPLERQLSMLICFCAGSSCSLLGTLSSLLFSSSSMTSFRGRLPAASSSISFSKSYIPGPLAALDLSILSPSYFANKRNLFNVIFVKKAWLWTTIAWGVHWLAGLVLGDENARGTEWKRQVVYRPLSRYILATVYWLLCAPTYLFVEKLAS